MQKLKKKIFCLDNKLDYTQIMSDRASPNLIEGLNGLKSLIGGGRDNYPLISGTNGKCQIYFRVSLSFTPSFLSLTLSLKVSFKKKKPP